MAFLELCGLSAQKQGFLRKKEEVVGNVLIFMELTVWDKGVEKQSKPKLLFIVIKTIGTFCPG